MDKVTKEVLHVSKHEDNKVHCVFNGIDYTKNIDAKFGENNYAIYKNNDALYQKYCFILHIKHAKLMHQTKL